MTTYPDHLPAPVPCRLCGHPVRAYRDIVGDCIETRGVCGHVLHRGAYVDETHTETYARLVERTTRDDRAAKRKPLDGNPSSKWWGG